MRIESEPEAIYRERLARMRPIYTKKMKPHLRGELFQALKK